MERVVVSDEAAGLGHMLGDLIRGNIAAHPDRVGLLGTMRGRVNIHAADAEVGVGLFFTGDRLSVGSVLPQADIVITCDSDTLLSLSSVPLRMGRPDVMTPEGRAVVGKILKRQLRIRGMFAHAKLMAQLQRLLSVS